MEAKLFENTSYVSTADFHKDREAVAHIDQGLHQPRMFKTVEYVKLAIEQYGITTVVDLGAGDGGMLSLLKDLPVQSFGYDFQPANIVKAKERGVDVCFANFIEEDVPMAELAICTECIEHLENPHQFLRELSSKAYYLICSSPMNERADFHASEHAWAWDVEGYSQMLINNGWGTICRQEIVEPFQVYLCESSMI